MSLQLETAVDIYWVNLSKLVKTRRDAEIDKEGQRHAQLFMEIFYYEQDLTMVIILGCHESNFGF